MQSGRGSQGARLRDPQGHQVAGACWSPLACHSPKRVNGQLGPRHLALVG